jgi:hypothetical protein
MNGTNSWATNKGTAVFFGVAQTVAAQTVARPIREFGTNSWATNKSTIEKTPLCGLKLNDKHSSPIPAIREEAFRKGTLK